MAKRLPSGLDAKIVADSINEWGSRLTTFRLRLPKTSLQDVGRHRRDSFTPEGAFDGWSDASMSNSSARAIPAKLLIDRVLNSPYVPSRFFLAHKGMVPSAWVGEDSSSADDRAAYWRMKVRWEAAAMKTAKIAEEMAKIDAAKVHINRMLEPYLLCDSYYTATEYSLANLFNLRDTDQAEYPLALVIGKARALLGERKPKLLRAGEWHRPAVSQADADALESQYRASNPKAFAVAPWFDEDFCRGLLSKAGFTDDEMLVRSVIPALPHISYESMVLNFMSNARMARISFDRQDVPTTVEADLARALDLGRHTHVSPFEHCATPTTTPRSSLAGNFGPDSGWAQWRCMLPAFHRIPDRQTGKTPYELLIAEEDT